MGSVAPTVYDSTDLPARHVFTVEEYHRMGEEGIFGEDARVELVAGELVDMAPIGSLHAAVVADLAEQLIPQLLGKATVYVQNPVCLGEYSEPQPDLSLLKPSGYGTALPRPEDIELILEVADTTALYDRETKVPLYGQHEIPEVWLIDLPARRAEVYRGLQAREYTQVTYFRNGKINSLAHPEGVIDLERLWGLGA